MHNKKKEKQNNRPILITGGHMTPALAVHSRLKREGFDNFLWLGHKHNQRGATTTSPEYKTINALKDTEFINLPTGKLIRSWNYSWTEFFHALKNLLKIPLGFLAALIILLRRRPSIIISFGGYLAVPVVFWGKLLRIPAITHEQTVVSGKANQLIAKLADKIFISWPNSAPHYPKNKTVLSGNPIRPDVFKIKSDNIKFNNDLPTVYITCGNQGAVVINRAVVAALPKLLNVANIIHQTGSAADTIKLLNQLKKSSDPLLTERYYHQPFLFADEVGEAFAKANLVVARAGANTVTEILALAKPALLIPIPWVTGNEQTRNAHFAQKIGIANILPEKQLTAETLTVKITDLIAKIQNGLAPNSQPLAKIKQQATATIPRDASDIIVKYVLDLM